LAVKVAGVVRAGIRLVPHVFKQPDDVKFESVGGTAWRLLLMYPRNQKTGRTRWLHKKTTSLRCCSMLTTHRRQLSKNCLPRFLATVRVTIKRAYGDWTTDQLRPWKEILQRQAIQPIQQFPNVKGKNATDSAMIIDAMDVLHSGHVDGICLVSSDSDFTRLANRIREAGLLVFGFGRRDTHPAFVAACDKFIYVEILRSEPAPVATDEETEEVPPLPPLKPMVLAAVDAAARDDGWAALAAVGSQISKNHSAFDSRNYGFPKLGELMRKQNYLEFKEVSSTGGDGVTQVNLYVRRKPKPAPAPAQG
jgi:uncharacterized LabA/DUF88 family protein